MKLCYYSDFDKNQFSMDFYIRVKDCPSQISLIFKFTGVCRVEQQKDAWFESEVFLPANFCIEFT